MSFRFQKLNLPGLLLIEAEHFKDERGLFMEAYKASEFSLNGVLELFVQDNFSHSVQGVLRGLHYQKQPKAQAKLVMVLRGEIFDVVVDIRKGSPTYGRWFGIVVSAERHHMLYIPEGFAHGFCVMSDTADVIYKVTQEYSPDLERGILWNDPQVGIRWPVNDPLVSVKDAELPLLKEADNDFVYHGERS